MTDRSSRPKELMVTGPDGKPLLKTEYRCNICKSPARMKVDKLIVAGFSLTSVTQELMESDEEFSDKKFNTVYRNIERHKARHLDIRNRAVREILEKRAKEQGMILDTVEGQITSGRALLDLLIAKATEQAADPATKVHYRDAIEAVRMLEETQKEEYTEQLEMLKRQVYAISKAVEHIVPKEYIGTLVERAQDYYENPDLAERQPVAESAAA